MSERADNAPRDWENQILFPARLLAPFPREIQSELQKAAEQFYRLLLQSGRDTSPRQGSAVAPELLSLIEELVELAEGMRAVDGLEKVAETLDEVIRQALRDLGAAGHEAPPPGDEPVPPRPFLRAVASDSIHYRVVVDLARALVAVAREPERERYLEALADDLEWVRTVLDCNIAPRGELAGLRPGDSALCRIGYALAEGLRMPVERLQAAARAARESASRAEVC